MWIVPEPASSEKGKVKSVGMKAWSQEGAMRRQTVFVETWTRTSSAGFRDSGPEASVIPLGGMGVLAPSEYGLMRGRVNTR